MKTNIKFEYFVYSLPIILYYFLFFQYAVNAPKWDDFAIIQFVNEISNEPNLSNKISFLLKQHNEHRIVFTRVIALVDYYIFGKVNFIHLMFVGNLALLLIVFLIVKMVFQKTKKFILCFVLLLFWHSLCFYENIFWGMAAIQNFWIIAWFLLSLYFLLNNSKYRILVYFFTLIAVYTSGNGILLISIYSLFFLVKQDTRLFLKWIIFGFIILIAYFFNYRIPSQNNLTQFDFLIFLKSVFLLAGSMTEGLILPVKQYLFVMVFGIIISLFSFYKIFILGFKIFTKKEFSNSELSLFAILFFCFGSIFMVVFSRCGQIELEGFLLSRYKVYSVLLVSVLLISFVESFNFGGVIQLFILISVLFWFMCIQHYFLFFTINQRHFFTTMVFNWGNLKSNTGENQLQSWERVIPFVYSNQVNKIDSTNSIKIRDKVHFEVSDYLNNNLLDNGLYLLLRNRKNIFLFPFIQNPKHSYRNLFNYSDFYEIGALFDSNLYEMGVLPGYYQVELYDRGVVHSWKGQTIYIPDIKSKEVEKNW